MTGRDETVVSMTKQRPVDRPRRAFLGAVGTATLAGVAGCVGSGRRGGGGAGSGTEGDRDRGEGDRNGGGRGRKSDDRSPITILAAGSLQNALLDLETAVDVPVAVEVHGSATVARLIAEGKRDPDIVSVADVALFEELLSPPWYSVFASNAVVIAYDPNSEGGRRIAAAGADGWYEPLIAGAVDLGRTDPDRDPLGYRALFTLELASRYYADAANLREGIPRREQIYPETGLLSRFETGAIDAAFTYRSMAVERGYEYVDLPDRIDLGDPNHHEEWYSTVSYTLPGGREIRGSPIGYGATIREPSDAALSVFAAHTTDDSLDEAGFLRREGVPIHRGAVPERVERATNQAESDRASRGSRVPASASASTAPDGTVPD
jgi:molybdate/tungstate transport system substrate-binding protein